MFCCSFWFSFSLFLSDFFSLIFRVRIFDRCFFNRLLLFVDFRGDFLGEFFIFIDEYKFL